MKSKLLILSFFVSLLSFGQKLPINGLCLSNVLGVTGGTCLTQAFANANATYFDPAYAVSGNCLRDFRNYGAGTVCVRPSGLSNVATYHTLTVDGATASFSGSFASASQALYVYVNSTDPARSMSGYNSQLFVPASVGDSVYVTFGTNCSKVVDGYYLYLPNQPVFPDYVYRIQNGVITEKTMASYTPATVPTLTTTTVTSIGTYSGSSGGTNINGNNGTITNKGVCWNTTGSPTPGFLIVDGPNNYTADGTGTANFTSSIAGIMPNTTYYVRAFAINSAGVGYGNQVSFTTNPISTIPTVTTNAVSSITDNSAISGGNVTSDGGSAVTARGVCWGTSSNPTTSGSRTSDGTGIGVYNSSPSRLTQNTTYYLRAYATNSVGTNYGGQVTFTTLSSATPPTVTTDLACYFDAYNALLNGTVSSDGGATVTARGFCWSTTNSAPTTNDSAHTVGSGTGYFDWLTPSFPSSTNIYIRAYATNSAGTSYGAVYTINSSNLCN